MTTKITKQFLDLAERFANHGKKHHFISGFTTIDIKETNIQIQVYFADYTKKDWSVYFSFITDYKKKIEVQDFSSKITFCHLMKTAEFNQIITESTKSIQELESMEIVIDEENEQIKAKINELQGQLQDLTKQLKS